MTAGGEVMHKSKNNINYGATFERITIYSAYIE